jgi:micrococcal nuclease
VTTSARWARISAVLLTLFFLWAAPAQARDIQGKVLWIYDGDTIEVAQAGKVRLLGIDTPEREASERDRFFLNLGVPPERLRQISAEGMRFLIGAVKGKQVRLTFDGDRRDRHGRLLAYVTLPDGRMLNRLLLENGHAVVYRRFDFRLKEEFLAAEKEAQNRKLGLWSR